jgi:NAD-dependent DNA ligase
MPPFPSISIAKDPKAYVAKIKSVEDADKLLLRLQDAYYNKTPLLTDEVYDVFIDAVRDRFGTQSKAVDAIGAPVVPSKAKDKTQVQVKVKVQAKGKVIEKKAEKGKVTLPVFMGSMNKIKTAPDQWIKKQGFGKESDYFLISDKMDGVSALLVDGNKMYSRGDGVTGQDITGLIPLIQLSSSSSSLKGKSSEEKAKAKDKTGLTGTIIRGELILSKTKFDEIKKNFEKNGKTVANARNLVSGLVNAKTPDVEVAKHVTFVAYALIEPRGLKPSDQFTNLKKMGFETPQNTRVPSSKLTFELLSDLLMKRRKESDYEMDGLVVAHDEWHPIVSGDNPEDAFAFKTLAMSDRAEVVVKEIEWNISKHGLFKPTVIFDPVHLNGVTIRKATGHNADFVREKVIGPGSKLLITRSGDVIPTILEAIAPATNGKPQFPPTGTWTWKGKDIVVVNDQNEKKEKEKEREKEKESPVGPGKEQSLKQLIYFFECLDIKGVGPGTLKKISEAGHTKIHDVIHLTSATLAQVPGMQNKAASFVADLKAALQTASCITIMKASNSFETGIGQRKLAEIAKSVPSILDVSKPNPTLDQLLQVPGVSNVTATKFLEGYTKFKSFLIHTGLTVRCIPSSSSSSSNSSNSTKGKGKTTKKEEEKEKEKDLVGEMIVFTGFRDKNLEKELEERGAEILSGVTKKTTILITNDLDDDSSKMVKARQLGIRIILRTALMDLRNPRPGLP